MFGRRRIRIPKKAMRHPRFVDPRMLHKVIPITDLDGNLLFEGTEAEWRQWVAERRQQGEFDLP